jgi:hypothetical protein
MCWILAMKPCPLVQFLLLVCMSMWLSEANLGNLLKDKEKLTNSVEDETGVFVLLIYYNIHWYVIYIDLKTESILNNEALVKVLNIIWVVFKSL